jgi:hypothetical protein
LNVTAIEGNVGAFLRCLLLKNYFNLKSKFLLGDFLKYMAVQTNGPDLMYASGVLYHLTDPVPSSVAAVNSVPTCSCGPSSMTMLLCANMIMRSICLRSMIEVALPLGGAK